MFKRYLLVIAAAFMLLMPILASGQDAAVKSTAEDHAWLGVYLRDYERTKDDATLFGALVEEVIDNSPAEEAGLKEGDVITKLADKTIRDADEMTRDLQTMKPGDQVELGILREGEKLTLKAKLGARQAQDAPERERHFVVNIGTPWLGVKVQDLNADLASYFQVKKGEGVLVTDVEEDGPAGKAGLKAGDVITAVGDKKVADVDDLHKALRKLDDDEKVSVSYVRKGRPNKADIKMEEDSRHLHYFRFNAPAIFPFDSDGWDITIDEMRDKELQLREKSDEAREKALRQRIEGPERLKAQLEFRTQSEMKDLKEQMEQLKEELQKMKEELKSQIK